MKSIFLFLILGRSAQALSEFKICAGAQHACALSSSSKIKCWGFGGNGALGNNRRDHIGDNPDETGFNLEYAMIPDDDYVDLRCGGHTSCAITANQSIICWGGTYLGVRADEQSLNVGDSEGSMLNVKFAPFSSGVTDLSIGYKHGTALLNDGRLVTFGSGANGLLGYNNTQSYGYLPGHISNASGVDTDDRIPTKLTSSSSSVDSQCVIVNNRDMMCWGNNSKGKLGTGNTQQYGHDPMYPLTTSPLVSFEHDIKDYCLGLSHVCAVLDNDAVKCWGGDSYGRILLHTNKTSWGVTPEEMQSIPDTFFGGPIKTIKCGFDETCVLRQDGKAICWRVGSTDNRYNKAPLPFSDPIEDIVLGSNFGCALFDAQRGIIKCWGTGSNGQTLRGQTSYTYADDSIAPIDIWGTSGPSMTPTTAQPSSFPTNQPTAYPSRTPSNAPSNAPSKAPSRNPSKAPTQSPSNTPTRSPSKAPTQTPSKTPTQSPSKTPTRSPLPKDITRNPTAQPTLSPTVPRTGIDMVLKPGTSVEDARMVSETFSESGAAARVQVRSFGSVTTDTDGNILNTIQLAACKTSDTDVCRVELDTSIAQSAITTRFVIIFNDIEPINITDVSFTLNLQLGLGTNNRIIEVQQTKQEIAVVAIVDSATDVEAILAVYENIIERVVQDLCIDNTCNARGVCDSATGICSCTGSYYGSKCEFAEDLDAIYIAASTIGGSFLLVILSYNIYIRLA